MAITLVRELGPVLTALLVAGRNASGIASELGSMKVTEQIDAMRALGTDPIQKLVTPRMIATCVMLPMLTIIADFVGMVGGYVIAYFYARPHRSQYWTTAYQALEYNDIVQGPAETFCLRLRHFAGGLLLRTADQRAARKAWAAPPPRPWCRVGLGVRHHLVADAHLRESHTDADAAHRNAGRQPAALG